MSQQWYLIRQCHRYGPYSWEQLREFAGSGQVMPEKLIWGNGRLGESSNCYFLT